MVIELLFQGLLWEEVLRAFTTENIPTGLQDEMNVYLEDTELIIQGLMEMN